MEKLIDGSDLECLGYTYSQDEAAAVILGLKLYKDQLIAGNIVDKPNDNHDAVNAILAIDELCAEIASDLTSVTPNIHAVIVTVILPRLVKTHLRLPAHSYERECAALDVTPMELFCGANTAADMMRESKLKITMVSS